MRKIKEVLRLKWENGLSNRQIAISCCISRPTVTEYINRAKQAGLTYPVSEGMGETELERLLFPPWREQGSPIYSLSTRVRRYYFITT